MDKERFLQLADLHGIHFARYLEAFEDTFALWNPESYLFGDVFVIGTREMFVERALLYIAPEYTRLSPNIRSITACDTNQYPHFTGPLDFYQGRAQEVLPYFQQDIFDVILALRINVLGAQINDGLLETAAAALKPGGCFVMSGDFLSPHFSMPPIPSLNVVNQVNLRNNENWGWSGYVYDHHLGFVLRKSA